jgi:lipopolysaccharide heptosyltransferase II
MSNTFDISVTSAIKALYLNTRGVVLKTLSLFLSRKKAAPLPQNIQSILFIRVDRIGDMVLSTPAFQAIKAALPQSRLTVMASPANAPILKNNQDVDEVIVYDRSAVLQERIKIITQLRSRHFSLAIDPYTDYELKTAWLAYISRAAHRVGYSGFGRELFFNCPAPKVEEHRHFIEHTLDLLKGIGIPSENRYPSIDLQGGEYAWASQWMQEKGFQGKKVIAIHPGAYYETQRWLPAYYAQLICLIREQTQADVILFGGPTDAIVVENILNKVSHPVCVFIQGDIRKFLALLSQCHFLVCNNSGPLHCAVALNIPTISFMGPTVKEQWMPIGEHHHVLRKDDLPCIGCNLGWCKIKTHDCMRLIEPDDVFKIIFEKMF